VIVTCTAQVAIVLGLNSS